MATSKKDASLASKILSNPKSGKAEHGGGDFWLLGDERDTDRRSH